MEAAFWSKIKDLKESISGGVKPKEIVTLKTKFVKLSLGLYLLEAIFIALIWSIRDGVGSAWFYPISAFIHVGWFWNKVTESWKNASADLLDESIKDEEQPFIPPSEPILNISNAHITGNNLQNSTGLFLSTTSN